VDVDVDARGGERRLDLGRVAAEREGGCLPALGIAEEELRGLGACGLRGG